MKCLVLGASGQVGRALRASSALSDSLFWGQPDCVFDDLSALEKKLDAAPLDVSVLINAAGYTAVDRAEKETDLAHRINAEAPAVCARWARSRDLPIVHFSSDYVYDGEGEAPHFENEPMRPLNAYGRSKAAGDQAIEASGAKFLILRTSWVFDSQGQNFPRKILELARSRPDLRVVSDQVGSPTFAPDLAAATVTVLEQALLMPEFPLGTYHVRNEGFTSWFEFAQECLAQFAEAGLIDRMPKVEPVPAEKLATAAVRPSNSRLDCQKVKATFGVTLPTWQDALKRCILNWS